MKKTTLCKKARITRLDLLVDWPKKDFSGQSAGRISTTSGTRLVGKIPRGFSALEVNFRAENIASYNPSNIFAPKISPVIIHQIVSK